MMGEEIYAEWAGLKKSRNNTLDMQGQLTYIVFIKSKKGDGHDAQ